MTKNSETSPSFQDQLAEIQEIMEREKVKLSPEMEEYLDKNIQRITKMIGEGQMPSEEDLKFFKEVRLWMDMPEEWRIEFPDFESALKSGKIDETKVFKLESEKRGISLRQWFDILNLIWVSGKSWGWMTETFEFPGNNRISTKGNLNLYNCSALIHLPDNLYVNGNLDIRGCNSLKKLPQSLGVESYIHMNKYQGGYEDAKRLEKAGKIPEIIIDD